MDTVDHIIDMHQKIMLKVYNKAQNQMQEAIHKHRKHFKHSELLLTEIIHVLLDETIQDSDVRSSIFVTIEKQELQKHTLTSKAWLSGKYSHLFRLVLDRFSYLRQFSPIFLKSLVFEGRSERSIDLIKAIQFMNEINQHQKRTLPPNIPLSFIPKKLLPFIQKENSIDRRAYECALLTKVRDEIKLGNLTIKHSKLAILI